MAWLATILVQKVDDGNYGPEDNDVFMAKTAWPWLIWDLIWDDANI